MKQTRKKHGAAFKQSQHSSQDPLQGRARIEQGVGKIKRFKRIALRCEKTAQNFAAFIALA